MYNKNYKRTSISTFSIKVFFLIVLFFGFPYVLITQLHKYQTKASGIIEQQNSIIEISSEKDSEMKVLTQAEAKTLNQIHEFIKGTWVSEFDGRYQIQIDENSKFEEFYDGTKEGFGSWRVFSATKDKVRLSNSAGILDNQSEDETKIDTTGMPSQDISQEKMDLDATKDVNLLDTVPSAYTKSEFENEKIEDPKYFFQKQQFEPNHKGEIYIYQIQQLDTGTFVLVFKSGNGKPLVFIRSTSTEMFSH